jgi:TetR/AcrR family transcriptional regulator, lmrAB and yxaGH operons repressor
VHKSTRDRMVETAIKMFQEHGYHGVSWRKLVQQAGTPWGSIAHHFPGGKVELAQAAIESGAEKVDGLIKYCFEKHKDSQLAIKSWFKFTAQHMQDVNFQTGCPVASIALSTTPGIEELSLASTLAFQRWESTLAALLSTNNLATERAAKVASTVVTLLEGGIVRARISQSTRPLLAAGNEAALLIARETAD